MKEVTVPIPESRIAEFYQKFGEFMADSTPGAHVESAPRTQPPLEVDGDEVARWIQDSNAQVLAATFWNHLSDNGKDTLGALIDRALDGDKLNHMSPEELIAVTRNSKAASGLAGVFGAAGRATKAARLPRYTNKKGNGDWSYIWNWDGQHYWIPRPMAELLDKVR